MTPIENWREVLKRAWSVRLIIVAGLLSGAEATLPTLAEKLPADVFAGLTFAITLGALVARFVAQPSVSKSGGSQ